MAANKRITLILPWPPSVNHLWKRGKNGGMFLARNGREYRKEVWLIWRAAGGEKFGKLPVAIELDAWPPDERRRDLDNLAKAILDALVSCGCLTDDWQVERLVISRRKDAKKKGIIKARIWALSDGAPP